MVCTIGIVAVLDFFKGCKNSISKTTIVAVLDIDDRFLVLQERGKLLMLAASEWL